MTVFTFIARFIWGLCFAASCAWAIGDAPDTKDDDANVPKSAGSQYGDRQEVGAKPGTKPGTKPGGKQGGFTRMGSDIQKFGEEVAQRIDRIVKKKSFDWWGDPWTMQGIPILFLAPMMVSIWGSAYSCRTFAGKILTKWN